MSTMNVEMLTIRQWFDKYMGNTYSSARAHIVIGVKEYIVTIPFYYGHGEDAAFREVTRTAGEFGIRMDRSMIFSFQRIDTCTVTRRKDMHFSGRGSAFVTVDGYRMSAGNKNA